MISASELDVAAIFISFELHMTGPPFKNTTYPAVDRPSVPAKSESTPYGGGHAAADDGGLQRKAARRGLRGVHGGRVAARFRDVQAGPLVRDVAVDV